jgi:hypothetical protein
MPEQIELVEAGPVRPLPVVREPGTIELWGREVGPVALAAGAGAVAGIVAIAATRAAQPTRRVPKRGLFRKREKIVGRRSFLVDVHVLGR